jgi:copper homeostasis protein
MQNGFVLEICVESVDRAVAAERGGAHRVELCTDLSSGGITPSAGLMQVARQNLSIPIHVLIRPRIGDFVYSPREIQIMEHDITMAKQLGMNAVVLGLLDDKRRVDVDRTARLVALAHPLPVTFHRAFDFCQDRSSSLEEVIQTGAARLLTSGGEARAMEGLAGLASLVKAAASRIVVMPGGGIGVDDIVPLLQRTAAREIHTSLRTASATGKSNLKIESPGGPLKNKAESEFEGRVRKVIDLCAEFSEAGSAG